MVAVQPRLLILGTRGIPAAHGGFETFAERLALFLTARGWDVSVYCQREAPGEAGPVWTDRWRGVERVHVVVPGHGPRATMAFDWLCIRHAAARDGLCLVLGYNTGVFIPWLRLAGRPVITNMDGIEWRRAKWRLPVKAWFYVNEWVAAWASHRLVADHPRIADHLASRRSRDAIAMIPYGGDPVTAAPTAPILSLGLVPDRYFVSIARIEPDNSIRLIVEAFSRRRRGMHLVVLGTLDPDNAYHRAVRNAAGAEVVFPGPIYDPAAVGALRFHARAYLHGHTVGGTNPSLVEALWAGNAVAAHDNPFNRWTAGEAALYFGDEDGCAEAIDAYSENPDLLASARRAARARAASAFDWLEILKAYERQFDEMMPALRPSEPIPALTDPFGPPVL